MESAVKKYLSKIGTKGGAARSDKKTRSCRLNAKKPRPGRKNGQSRSVEKTRDRAMKEALS